jgi:hypothetical protein
MMPATRGRLLTWPSQDRLEAAAEQLQETLCAALVHLGEIEDGTYDLVHPGGRP